LISLKIKKKEDFLTVLTPEKYFDILKVIDEQSILTEDVNVCSDIRVLQDQLASFGF
jgi:hypothetical protein